MVKGMKYMFNYNKMSFLRKRLNLTQQQLADKLNVSPSAVGMWEQGRREPDNETLVNMAQLFECSTDYLLDNQINSTNDLPPFDEYLDKETAVKMVKDYINSQNDWSEEKKKMSIKQIDLMFGDDE